jgi:hypothetical protein
MTEIHVTEKIPVSEKEWRMDRQTQRPGGVLLAPDTPAGYAELLIRARLDAARARGVAARSGTPSDRGASVVEWVIISALVVGIAVAVGAILLTKLRDKATSIDLNTGGGGGGGGGGGAP